MYIYIYIIGFKVALFPDDSGRLSKRVAGDTVILGLYIPDNFSPTVPPFAARISRVVADVQASGGESGNV